MGARKDPRMYVYFFTWAGRGFLRNTVAFPFPPSTPADPRSRGFSPWSQSSIRRLSCSLGVRTSTPPQRKQNNPIKSGRKRKLYRLIQLLSTRYFRKSNQMSMSRFFFKSFVIYLGVNVRLTFEKSNELNLTVGGVFVEFLLCGCTRRRRR